MMRTDENHDQLIELLGSRLSLRLNNAPRTHTHTRLRVPRILLRRRRFRLLIHMHIRLRTLMPTRMSITVWIFTCPRTTLITRIVLKRIPRLRMTTTQIVRMTTSSTTKIANARYDTNSNIGKHNSTNTDSRGIKTASQTRSTNTSDHRNDNSNTAKNADRNANLMMVILYAPRRGEGEEGRARGCRESHISKKGRPQSTFRSSASGFAPHVAAGVVQINALPVRAELKLSEQAPGRSRAELFWVP